MNIEQVEQQVLINEWQLGQQLNTAVHTGTRDKFNLLLSLLSDDARDFAQFEVKEKQQELDKQTDYRAYFQLPQTQPLVNEGPSSKLLAELNTDLQNKKLTDIRFKQLLTNEALLSRKEGSSIPDDILDNIPLLKKQRVNAAYQSNLSSNQPINKEPIGVDLSLLDEYQKLDFENRPLQVSYS